MSILMKNRYLKIVSAFRISPEICFSSTGTYFKTQLKLTHFIKSIYNIPGPVELSYTLYRSKMYDRIFKKIYFQILHTCLPRPNFLKIVKMANNRQFRDFLQL